MPALRPITRRELIYWLRQLRFEGPFPGRRHEFMIRGETRVTIPNPHRGDISLGLLRQILREAGVSRQQWEQL